MPPDVIRGSSTSRLFLALLALLASLAFLVGGFILLREMQTQESSTVSPLVTAVLAITWGVGGLVLLFMTTYHFVERLPMPWPARLEPWVFVGPALLMLIWALTLPALRTIGLSLQDADSVNFVGLQNYQGVFSDPAMLTVFRNNLLWMLIGTTFTVSFGLLVAVLADRSRYETLAKALIFLPMAISFVGAGVIWNFICR
jgi:alpha-glucoside transport system permease protein